MTEITVPLTQANPRRSIVGVSFVSIAWRNLWRNMRRSWLMITSVAFIVLLIVFMHSSQMGIFGTMIDLQANQLHGHAQIQHPKYNDDPRVEYTVPHAAAVLERIRSDPRVRVAAPRVMTHGLVSVGEKSVGAMVVGIDSDQDFAVIKTRVDAGRYLQQDGEAVVGSVLARNLGVGVGDEVVFLGSGKESGIAALVATVVGTFTSGIAVLDRSQVHVTLSDLGGALGLSDEVHAIALQLDTYTSSQPLVDDHDGEILGNRLANWETLMPDLAAQLEMKMIGGVAFYALFVVLVTFGVVNAFIMTIHERTQEFGVLLALGMRPGAIVGMLQIEALCMSVLGLLVGISLAAVVVSFVQVNIASLGQVGEMYEHLNLPQVLRGRFNLEAAMVTSAVIVLATQLAAVVSTLKLYRMKVVEALMTEE